MNKTIGIQLGVYALLLAGLSYVAHHLAPAGTRPTLVTGLAGCSVCVACAARAVVGNRGKALPILALVLICCIQLEQAIMICAEQDSGPAGRQTAAAVMAVLFVLSLGMLVRIAYAGVAFGGERPNPTNDGQPQPQANGSSAGQSPGGKRA